MNDVGTCWRWNRGSTASYSWKEGKHQRGEASSTRDRLREFLSIRCGGLFFMCAHVLSFGYDRMLMRIRTMVLRTRGHEVTEVYSLIEALRLVSVPGYDLLLICHTVPEDQQQAVTERAEAMAGNLPVLCLTENPGIKYSENCKTASNTAPELLNQIEEALWKSKERRAA